MTTGAPPYDDASLRAARQVVESLRASNLQGAYEISDRAILRGLRHPALFNARALWFEAHGRTEDALTDFERTRTYVPNDANLLLSIGGCLTQLGRAAEAIAVYESANAIKPDSAVIHRCWGDALVKAGSTEAAAQMYNRAIAVDPGDAMAIAGLAALAVRRHDVKNAIDYAKRALALDPGNIAATLCLANAELINRDFASVERRLRSLPIAGLAPAQRATVLSLLGDALDGSDNVREAFAAYSAAKAELRRLHAPQFANARAIDAANALIKKFEHMPAGRWAPPKEVRRERGEPDQHIFLLGFMRSGTTLLESALASHPDVVVMDEHDVLREANRTFLTSPEGIEQLADLGSKEIARWRRGYWEGVREHGIAKHDRVFVDKLPFHTVKLPIIAKFFPDAKILFCLRDPRDVVFSSFRRPFEVNATVFEFLSLDDGAQFYAAIMRLAGIYRSILPLSLHEHRYEAMIANFKQSLTAVCDFIGIDWVESMCAFSETARSIDIRNPSATQVRRPLNAEGMGQWRRYREQIQPAIRVLEPLTAAFGYSFE
jgi:tetratricopeptide (TPR) repeat protein